MVYLPPGCAHGFLTLVDQTEMIYFASSPHSAAHERVIRWDDRKFAIGWPMKPKIISQKDRTAPDYSSATHSPGY